MYVYIYIHIYIYIYIYIKLCIYNPNRNFGGNAGSFMGRIVSIDPDNLKYGVVVRYDFGKDKVDHRMNLGGLADHCKIDHVLESHAINYDNSLVVSFCFYLYCL